jgi:hypothetical protein
VKAEAAFFRLIASAHGIQAALASVIALVMEVQALYCNVHSRVEFVE